MARSIRAGTVRANVPLFENSQKAEPRCECGKDLALTCKRCTSLVAIPLPSREGWGTAISQSEPQKEEQPPKY